MSRCSMLKNEVHFCTRDFLNRCIIATFATVKEAVGVGEEGRMVDVRMELQKQRWCMLVGEGAGYKVAGCWLVSDKTD